MAPTALVGLTDLPVLNSTQRSQFACAAARAAWQVPRRGGRIATSAAAALQGADVLAIVTEWKEFRTPDFEAIKAAMAHHRAADKLVLRSHSRKTALPDSRSHA